MNRAHPTIPFLLDLLRLAVRQGADAAYVVPWKPPALRLGERVVNLSDTDFTPEQTRILVRDLMDAELRRALDTHRDVRFSVALDDGGRFRVHAFRRHGQPAMVVRPFCTRLPTPAALGLPPIVGSLALADRGLVLVASGSATLRGEAVAALVDHRNRQGQGCIVVLDGASRFWHEPQSCTVEPCADVAQAEMAAARRTADPAQEPVCIVWGELRDHAALMRAVQAANSALCLVTMPARSALHVLEIACGLADSLDYADGHGKLAMAMHGAIALRWVPAADGRERVAATEVLLNSPEIAADLSERDFAAVQTTMRASRRRGMQTTDDHLQELVQQGVITEQAASEAADDPAGLTLSLAMTPARALDVDLEGSRAATAGPGLDDLFEALAREPTVLARAAPAPVTPPAWRVYACHPAPGRAQVDIWACQGAMWPEVDALARAGEEPRPVEGDEGTPLAITLVVDGLAPAPVPVGLSWDGAAMRFRFVVPASVVSRPARARVLAAGIPVGEIEFALPAWSNDSLPQEAPSRVHPPRRTFASYAAEDRGRVFDCVRRAQAIAPDLDVFLEAPPLRWDEGSRERIAHEIESREQLLLFWSHHAGDSPWLDVEWRMARDRHGAAAVELVALDDSSLASAPAELTGRAPAEPASVDCELQLEAADPVAAP